MNRLLRISRCHINTYRNNVIRTSPVILSPPKVFTNCAVRELHQSTKSARSTLNYVIAVGVMTVGLSYAAVPLYRIFCQVYYFITLKTCDTLPLYLTIYVFASCLASVYI